ncbi:RNA polymerase-associated protein RTF1 [Marchantia polymorpha subsp. ruderalis]|uniref:Plus3 domain-containing protein n=2 Tax=Marchantia polymorpha TaxID=3197 RepID=A0AAF6AR00_MARPO|nr:hypothetical protein MARPO_0001s0024 [Marchantia polymorpha]BBM98870.1 hypothetical protein Mp_1g16830 [Marchantia polymorpha subsp. ruderalis]|eukprot:PTQ49947.1 hypothetical protein MARPO_0001s0024 [Marchantia polymorpha]
MADSLDDMLLEAAGRPKGGHGDVKAGSSSRPPKRRGPVNDSSSDDRSGGSENDFDDDDDYERGRSSRKAEGSKMPLKKRFDSAEKDGDEGERDGYESDISFGSDLYKDDEDRARLAAMTELDREMILHDRAEARDNHKMRKDAGARHNRVQNKAAKPRERDVGPPSSRIRSSFRESRETPRTSKENALHELVQRRQRAQDPELQKKNRDTPASASRERDRRSSARKTRNRSYSDSDYSDDDDESSREDDDRSVGASDDDDVRKGEPDADWQDIKSITIRRSKLHKWFMEPFFEDVIVGCYVRIGIGVSSSGQSIYRVCSVKNVDATAIEKQYKFENRMTHKYLNLVWGDENSAARWQMVRASDQAPTEKEVLELFREIDRCGGKKLSKADVQEKREAIAKVSSFVYSAATVKQMIQEKKNATSRPSNIALEKDRIVKELAAAENKGDHGEIDRLQARLRELEEFSSQVKSKDSKALALAEMNRKNKFENFKNASDLKPVNVDAKAGEAGYDPFSRRWTRSQNYYKTDGPKDESVVDEADEGAGREKPVATSSEAAALYRGVPSGVAKTKLFEIHDFDIHISLAPLQQLGGSQGAHAAYMSRKQKLEASCGAQIDSSDGRRHTLTLTVNDYKRRRGLL